MVNGTRNVSFSSNDIPESFINTAFTADEQKLINTTLVSGKGYAVQDKIFILDMNQMTTAEYGFNDVKNGSAYISTVARMSKHDNLDYNSHHFSYWLRDGDETESNSCEYKYVVSEGGGISTSYTVDTTSYKVVYNQPGDIYVRPAMWINYKSNKVGYLGTITDLKEINGDGNADIKYTIATNSEPMEPVNFSEVELIKPNAANKKVTYDPIKMSKPGYSLKYNGISLVEDRDYKVTLENDDKVGTVSITFTGKGQFSGTLSDTYTITASNITYGTWIKNVDSSDQEYTGKEIKPNVQISYNRLYLKDTDPDYYLVKDRDYTVTYENNIYGDNNKMGKIVIKGIGNYTGTITYNFKILNGPDGEPSDVNGDGKFNLSDVLNLLKGYFNNASVSTHPEYDINRDGKFNLTDVLALLKLYFSNK